jgi:putative sporulation protein YtaF
LLSAVLVAMVSNLDNLAAGVAFGMRDTRIAAAPNVVIAVVTMAATTGAMTSGHALSRVLSPSLAAALGASIISAIGVWTVLASLRAAWLPANSPEPGNSRLRGSRLRLGGELDRKKVISCREALALGVALSLNNTAAGVGAGVAGISPLPTTVLAGGLSLIFVGGGSRVGLSVGRLVGGSPASLIAGLILLGVGATILSGAG